MESYTSDGQPRQAIVQFVLRDGIFYIRTDPTSGKVNRIAANPRVRIVPCNRKGEPTGTWVQGEAALISGTDQERAKRIMRAENGFIGNLFFVTIIGWIRGAKLTKVIAIRPKPKPQVIST